MLNPNYYKLVDQTTDELIVSVEDARRHLFIYDDDSSDAIIEQYIATAQELVTDWINQPLVPSIYVAYYYQLDSFTSFTFQNLLRQLIV